MGRVQHTPLAAARFRSRVRQMPRLTHPSDQSRMSVSFSRGIAHHDQRGAPGSARHCARRRTDFAASVFQRGLAPMEYARVCRKPDATEPRPRKASYRRTTRPVPPILSHYTRGFRLALQLQGVHMTAAQRIGETIFRMPGFASSSAGALGLGSLRAPAHHRRHRTTCPRRRRKPLWRPSSTWRGSQPCRCEGSPSALVQ